MPIKTDAEDTGGAIGSVFRRALVAYVGFKVLKLSTVPTYIGPRNTGIIRYGKAIKIPLEGMKATFNKQPWWEGLF
ncbi:hypothetical protein [Pleionea sp. CnH1-48]|uniref:hypothetical protein n=1 Tax=Pleionea sp. CnH1-48 TaxID=2954494 RepID=UPI002097E5EC|nr:hypothetical protein [Pleionea sp. CnH1-48]MCO7224808.1 hypothetical protein [Pleionea sp. CnH1-48]